MTTESATGRRVIRGTAAAPGIAMGPWARFDRAELPAGGRVAAADAEAEVTRVREAAEAVAIAAGDLAADVRRDGHDDEADIFDAHAAIARDPELIDTAVDHIRTRLFDGPAAIAAAGQSVAELLQGLDDRDSARAGDRCPRRRRPDRAAARGPSAGRRRAGRGVDRRRPTTSRRP